MRLIVLLWTMAAGTLAAEFDHSAWDAIVKKYVNAIGEVDYGAAKQSRAPLDAYVRRLAESSPGNRKDEFPSRAHELAYWINAYNALVMKGVVDAYPTRSVRDLGILYGFFRRKDYTLGGTKMSLQNLENDIIRKRYNEPRIHFAIVCASVSCPVLSREAFTAANLEAQLDRLSRGALSQRRMLWIDEKANEISLTPLLNWYKTDFGDAMAFVRKYASEADRKRIDSMKNPKIRYYDYDWSINDPGSRAKAKTEHERAAARP